jgi:hypothetical protein
MESVSAKVPSDTGTGMPVIGFLPLSLQHLDQTPSLLARYGLYSFEDDLSDDGGGETGATYERSAFAHCKLIFLDQLFAEEWPIFLTGRSVAPMVACSSVPMRTLECQFSRAKQSAQKHRSDLEGREPQIRYLLAWGIS